MSRLYTLRAYACAQLWRKDCEASEVTAQVLGDVINSWRTSLSHWPMSAGVAAMSVPPWPGALREEAAF